MASHGIRRALFPSTPNSSVERSTTSSPTVISCSETSECTDSTEKECVNNGESKEFHDVVIEDTDRASKKVLVVGVKMTAEISKQLTGMPLLQDIAVRSCSPNNLLGICRKEKFILVFVDKFCDENCIAKICSTLRYNSSSLNNSVPIIGVSDTERDHISNYGLNDVIMLPLQEDTVNHLLLKFAGIIPFKGLPLTPESPDDDVVVARKAAEIIRESEQQSVMLGLSKDNCGPKDSGEVESAFEPPEEQESHSKQLSSSLYTNTNTNLYLPSTSPMEDDHNNTRQQALNFNTTTTQVLTRSTVSPTCHEDFCTRDHTGWGVSQECPPGHVAQNTIPGPSGSVYGEHVIGHHMDSCHGYSGVPSIYQQNYPPVPVSNQLQFKPVSQYPPVNTSYETKPQEKILPSQETIPPTFNIASSLPSQVKMNTFGTPAYMVSGAPGSKDMKITILPEDLSKHSSKERVRRERIKESCDKLRFLLPNISGKKTDMASILEMTVKFVKLVNERIPAAVMQEIAESLSINTISLCRKRAQKELTLHNSKQPKTRMVSPQLQLPIVPSIIPGDTQGHYRMRGPSMVDNNGPIYLSHVYRQHCTSSPHKYNPYPSTVNYGSSHAPMMKDIQEGFYSTHTSVVNQGFACNATKDIPIIQTFPPHSANNAQMCHTMNTQISICPHRPLSMNTSTPNTDMPQQWSFLKLPPINTISPCGTNFSRSSSEEQSTRSDISSPSGSMDSPLWEEQKPLSLP